MATTRPTTSDLQGQPASFKWRWDKSPTSNFPIDDASWDEAIQDGEDSMAVDSEDAPGFSLVVASAAIAMAVFVNARREEE